MGGNPTLEEFGKNLTTFRFAVLHHEVPLHSQRKSHWDFLLEPPHDSPYSPNSANETLLDAPPLLLTFEVLSPPNEWFDHILPAKRLADHRPVYLDYEGPIPGGRGHVKKILAGTIQWKILEIDLLELSIRQTWPGKSDGLLRIARSPGNGENDWEMQWQVASVCPGAKGNGGPQE